MDWRALPKVELHLHLDCSLSYEVVSRIEPSITQDDYRARFVAPRKCRDLSEFLACAPVSFPLMQTAEHLRWVTLDLFDQLAADGAIYAEIRFAPTLHTEGGLSPRQVVAAVDAAVAEGIAATGVEARIILCALKYRTAAESMAVVRLVEAFAGTHVVAFDVAADKPGNVIDDHVPSYAYAREHGLHHTAHSGETRGVGHVWETVRAFDPPRIGHGVSSIQDPALVALLIERGTHLEACPVCNVQTDCYETLADHPVDRLHRAGVSIGLNTDARALVGTTLTDTYTRMHETFGWEPADFAACNRHALAAAFVDEATRERLGRRLAA